MSGRDAKAGQPSQRRPDTWFSRVVGVAPGKERCSSAGMAGFVYGGKRWVQYESVPDFLLLARERPRGWTVMRGYAVEDRIRRDRGANSLREARQYATSLTGGLLSPWLAVPLQLTTETELLAFAEVQFSGFADTDIGAGRG